MKKWKLSNFNKTTILSYSLRRKWDWRQILKLS